MAPAGDMKWSEQAMNESFYLSNICPQNHNLNGGDWKALEEHLRTMATQYEKVYIACGPIVSAKPKTIGTSNQIAVPDAFFKAILRKNGESWSAIGFMMPNVAGHKPLNKYAMSIDEIEIITDIDFFVALPDSIEEKIESVYNLKDWDL
jgi:endonuclease G